MIVPASVSTSSAVRNSISVRIDLGMRTPVHGLARRAPEPTAVPKTRRNTLNVLRIVPGLSPVSANSAMKRRTSAGSRRGDGPVGSFTARVLDGRHPLISDYLVTAQGSAARAYRRRTAQFTAQFTAGGLLQLWLTLLVASFRPRAWWLSGVNRTDSSPKTL